ncbi:MAG: hypothetical protein JXA90_00425, partial [Planctomycetes bacterium]|nr:hypothetical protein [Planctomycetota bacterium]
DEGSEIVSVRIQRAGEDDLLVERRSRVKKEETSEKDGAEEKDEAKEETKDETKKEPEPEEYFVVTQAAETHEVTEKKWAARGILDRAKSIRFEDAVEPKDPSEYGLDKPQLKVIISYRKKDVEGAAINELKLSFGNAIKDEKGEDKAYYFLFEGPGSKGRITTVEKWDFSGWNKQLKEFLPEPKKEETEDEKAEPEDAKEAADSPEDPAPGEPAGPGVDPAKEPAPESANAPVSEPSGEPAEPVKEAGPGATGSPAPVSEPSGEPAESAESAE